MTELAKLDISPKHQDTYLCWSPQGYKAAKSAEISIHDLGLRRGYGVFDFLRTYEKVPFMLESHVDKFFNSANLLKLNLPKEVTKDKVYEAIATLVECAPKEELTLTLMATAGKGSNLFTPDDEASVFIFCQPLLKSIEVETIHPPIQTITTFHERPLPYAKSLNYFPAVAAIIENGPADEVLYIDRTGALTEASRSNLFAVKDGTLITPSKNILYGATREVVLKLNTLPIQHRAIPLEEIYSADEVFVASTLKEVCPVGSIDGRKIGNGEAGPHTTELQKRFKEYVKVQL